MDLKTLINRNITKIAILVTIILSLIYVIAFTNQYSLYKAAETAEINFHGYYSGVAPFSATISREMPLLIISIIAIVAIWSVQFVITSKKNEIS